MFGHKTWDGNTQRRHAAADERVAGHADRARAGQRFDAPSELLIETHEALAFVAVCGRVNAK